jgi:hypothetical protein
MQEEDDIEDGHTRDFDDDNAYVLKLCIFISKIKEGKRGSAGQYGCTLVHSCSPASVAPHPLSNVLPLYLT